MIQNKKNRKSFERGSLLLRFFPDTELLSEQKQVKGELGIEQKKSEDTANEFSGEPTLREKESAEKAVFVSRTEEISFEEFLKSRWKRI